MEFLWGIILGGVAGVFVWELGKRGLAVVKKLTSKK